MDDQRLEQLASTLGHGAENHVNLDRVTQEVLGRTRQERIRAPRSWTQTPVVRAAALVGVLIAGALVARTVAPESMATAEFSGPMALEELSAADLGEVLDSLTYDAPISEQVAGSLDDLDESQLRELLATLES